MSPCPMSPLSYESLILLAEATGRLGLGIFLVLAFGLGTALVLVALCVLAGPAQRLLCPRPVRGGATRGRTPAAARAGCHVPLGPLESRCLRPGSPVSPVSPTPVPVPITGLFNTGVASTGVATAAGTADSHYAVVASP